MKIIRYILLSFVLCAFILLSSHIVSAQPWKNPLMYALSANGTTYETPQIFQDSSGVPSVIRWRGDTLICVFQWFRQPVGSPSWDRVAVKFSYNNGTNWTSPVPINVNGIPPSYQRPFDPTLALIQNESIRLYFSSSSIMPPPGADSLINTYSAVSTDGINYNFEEGARVDHPQKKVIDPAVIYFNNMWHFTAPIGAPQEGAYHYISNNGLDFTRVADITSDQQHNWTGNFLINGINDLHFYGSGNFLWYNTSANGGVWSGYISTNLHGGDPSVVKLNSNNYMIIYVGMPLTKIDDEIKTAGEYHLFQNYPNPFNSSTVIRFQLPVAGYVSLKVYDIQGEEVVTLVNKLMSSGQHTVNFNASELSSGVYFCKIQTNEFTDVKSLLLIK